MAKKKTISVDEAMEQLSELRAGRGGRKSKYEPILQDLGEMDETEVYVDEVEGYNQVSSLRNSIDRRFGEDEYVVKASKSEEDAGKDSSEATYKVFIFHSSVADDI